VQIGHTRLQWIAHRSDTRGAAFGPTSSMTLSEIASGLPAGQRNPSALGMKILRSGAVVADFAAKCEVGQRR